MKRLSVFMAFLVYSLQLACSTQVTPPAETPVPDPTLTFTPSVSPTSIPTATPTTVVPTEPPATSTITPTFTPRPTRTATPPPEWVTNFAEPILTHISARPADMKDEFSWSSDAWVLRSYQAEWRKSVKNGEMTLNAANAQYPAIKFHDYVLEVTARQVKADWHGFEFSNILTEDGGFRCTFMILNDLGHFGCGAIGQQTDIQKRIPYRTTNTLLVIIKGGQIATYLNEEPFGFIEDDRYRLYRGTLPYAGLFSSGTHAFSEFKVWNITRFETP